jgi:sarcosine oxidase delta subunit
MIPGTGNDHRMLVYGPNMFNEENFHCSVLPMVSVYDPKTDAGLVVVQPVEMAKPRMEYFFVRENPDLSLVVRWTHLRLTRGQSVKAKMLLAPIRGCWRDAVRFVHDLYPDYFRVHEPAVFKHEGPMTCAELLPENHLNHLVEEQKLSWQEIHAYVFPRYGEYAPRSESWPNWVAHGKLEYFDLERLSRTEFRGMLSAVPDKKEEIINRRQFNAYIDKLHCKGVGAFLYTNPVIVSIDHINDFPGSLATCAEGTPFFRDYFREAPMNPAAGTTWAKHLDLMTQRMLEQFPGIDGFFVDELHWNQFDFAHDDGVSARGNKPVAMIGFAVQDAVRRICEMAHQKGKVVWANGPNTLEVAHYIDGFMAEVSWEWLGTARYLGLEKPVVLLMSTDLTVDQLKKALDTTLFAGAQPSVLNQAPMDSERLEVIHRYQILFQMLRGRRWILYPHAITLEAQEMRANCFALPDGDFAVTLAPTGESDYQLRTSDGYAMDRENIHRVEGSKKNMKVTLQWPELVTVRSARLFSVTEPDRPVELEMERTQGGLSLSLSSIEAGVIRLSRRS